jgi:peptidylprolyl isomerase/FKBP-type peptidyl-prolyl cis-trans isomerase FklB
VFDSSYKRGQPAVFVAGQLIPAWTEALEKMKPGDTWLLYVPPNLGYGVKGAGPIPPNSLLIFKIQLISVLPRDASVGNG